MMTFLLIPFLLLFSCSVVCQQNKGCSCSQCGQKRCDNMLEYCFESAFFKLVCFFRVVFKRTRTMAIEFQEGRH